MVGPTLVALYAAVLSTITGAVQLWNFFCDRARIKIFVRHNRRLLNDPRYQGKTLTIVRVVNAGRRPVTISTVGAESLHPHNHFVIRDCQPPLPYELTEGKNLIAILPPCDIDFSTIDFWQASDAVGRAYKLRVSSCYAHVLSKAKWRLEWQRNKRESAKGVGRGP